MNRAVWVRLAPLLVAALFAVLFFAGLMLGDPSRVPSAHLGKTLPAFALPGLDGEADGLSAADLATGRPVLLNVWASWCGPCRDEHPALMALAEAGTPVFGLNYKDNRDNARRFLGRLGNPYVKTGVDADGRAAIDLGVYGVPETFLLAGDGTVVLRHVGPLDADILQQTILPYLRENGETGTPRP